MTPCGYGCGAGHGAEIQYVFDHLGQDARPWSAYDRQLANRLAESIGDLSEATIDRLLEAIAGEGR